MPPELPDIPLSLELELWGRHTGNNRFRDDLHRFMSLDERTREALKRQYVVNGWIDSPRAPDCEVCEF